MQLFTTWLLGNHGVFFSWFRSIDDLKFVHSKVNMCPNSILWNWAFFYYIFVIHGGKEEVILHQVTLELLSRELGVSIFVFH